MTEHVHFIPVGFDYERLIYPISKGEMEADRVVIYTHEGEAEDNADAQASELAGDVTDQLLSGFDLIDVKTTVRPIDIDAMRNYERMYPDAYTDIKEEVTNGDREVYLNISSMPRTVAFAFATAADTIITEYQDEYPDIRDRLHTYYVAPEKYLVLDMISALENAEETLHDLDVASPEIDHALEDVQQVLSSVYSSGVTEGARETADGQMYVEFPTSPGSDVEDFEKTILLFLARKGPIPSTSELAKRLAEDEGAEYDSSYRSRVQYNVSNLEEKGYVDRETQGNSMETQLSTMGKMWVNTHVN